MFQSFDGGIEIPVPVRSRTVTNGDVVLALRAKEGRSAEGTPSEVEEMTCTMIATESRRRFCIARGRTDEAAAMEACILRDALRAMDEDQWWRYEYELIDGLADFLTPFLEAELHY